MRLIVVHNIGMAVMLSLAHLALAHDGDHSSAPEASTPSSAAPPAAVARIARLEAKPRDGNASSMYWVQLGDALMQKSRESLDPREVASAERAYEKALGLDPQNVQAMLGMAWVHNTEHAFDVGRRFAQDALKIDPKLPEAHALLGDAAVELGDYDAGFEHYQEALDLRPNLSSYSRAAHLLWLTGDTVKAQALMHRAIAAGGPYAENAAWCRAQLALMAFHNGSLMTAERQAEQALSQGPDNPQVLAVMGRIKAAKKEYDPAIEHYERAVAVAPSHESLVALGELYALAGRKTEAEETYARVVALHTPGEAHSHGGREHVHASGSGNAQLARFYADRDRNLDDALREAEAAYRAFPNVYVADTLAWCYFKKGLYDEAKKTIAKALRWKTPDASILFHAGIIYAQAGDREAAKRLLYRALNLNPHFHPRDARLAVSTLKELSEPPPTHAKPPEATRSNSL